MLEIICYHEKDIPQNVLQRVKQGLEATYAGLIVVSKFKEWELPEESYHPRRNQHDATLLMEYLLAEVEPKKIKLGIIKKDLFVPGMNFVFGLAQARRAAVVSLHRLDSVDFIKKEAIHEIGHVLGLKHCQLPCVMTFSNSVFEARQKSSKLCPKCKKILGIA